MILTALDADDSLERQNAKLIAINKALMLRVEQNTNAAGAAYAHFERAALLESEVRARTRDLAHALDLLNESNARLAEAHVEAEAARSNLANAIETLREGFALFNADDVLVMCNSRFCALTPDVRPFLAPGLTFSDYVARVSESAHLALPEDESAADWAALRKARHKDPHVTFNVALAGERCIQVSEHRTAAGGTVIMQTDVSDMMRLHRQERERIMDEEAEITRATLEFMTEGVCVFDDAGRLVSWNGRVADLLPTVLARLSLGRSMEALFEELGASGGPLEPLMVWAAAEQRSRLLFEVSHGTSQALRVNAQAIPRGFVVSFTDVTAEREALRASSATNELLEQRVLERTLELQDAVAAAERANATKSRFVAAASHDLLQPLSAAKLYVGAMDDEDDAQSRRRIVAKAQLALGSVETILGDLLDISRLDSNALAMNVTDVPLGSVLRRLGTEFEPIADQKGLALSVLPSSLTVRSDATYLRRILQNLIANAIKYTAAGRVVVGVRRRGAAARLLVTDTGPGIPESAHDEVFREFVRLGGTASASEGLGLGLAIVERACALLNHPLDLVSVMGRGTTFTVTVPLAAR